MNIDPVTQPAPTAAAPSSPRHADVHLLVRRALRALWSGVRQVAWGVDAFSRVAHGMDVPSDHPARGRSAARAGAPRRRRTA